MRRPPLPTSTRAERLQLGVAAARRELEERGHVSEWFFDELFLELDALVDELPLEPPLRLRVEIAPGRETTLRRGPSAFGPGERTPEGGQR